MRTSGGQTISFPPAGVSGGRLSVDSANPVGEGDNSATLYFLPYQSDKVQLHDGVASWVEHTIPGAGVQLAAGGLAASTTYDVFLYDDSGTLTLLAVAWTNDTIPSEALGSQDGVDVRTGDSTRLYLGTVRTTATPSFSDGGPAGTGKRQVANRYNRVLRATTTDDTTDSWSDNGNGTWSAINGSSVRWKHTWVTCRDERKEVILMFWAVKCDSRYVTGAAIDSTTAVLTTNGTYNAGVRTGHDTATGYYTGFACVSPGEGTRVLQILETTLDAAGPYNAAGDGGVAAGFQSGLMTVGMA